MNYEDRQQRDGRSGRSAPGREERPRQGVSLEKDRAGLDDRERYSQSYGSHNDSNADRYGGDHSLGEGSLEQRTPHRFQDVSRTDRLRPGAEVESWNGSMYRSQQSFRGRGPKGYERSDERLREVICERLTDDPHIDASDITVTVHNRAVTLQGTVDDRRTKDEVEELIEACGGVENIRNELHVPVRNESSPSDPNELSSGNPLGNSEADYGTSGMSGIGGGGRG